MKARFLGKKGLRSRSGRSSFNVQRYVDDAHPNYLAQLDEKLKHKIRPVYNRTENAPKRWEVVSITSGRVLFAGSKEECEARSENRGWIVGEKAQSGIVVVMIV